jgi:hypothetical protein
MKSLQEFKTVVEEEKQDFTKFDALVRAGLANKAQLQRLHQILGKMSEEKPNFSPADRAIIQNMFTKMVDMITNNPQMYRTARKAVSEGLLDTADFKLDITGRKVKAHRVKVGDALNTLPADNIKEEIEMIGEDLRNEPPFVLLLKRTAVRLYPGNLRVATYHNQKLNRDFAIPFSITGTGDIQSEEVSNDEFKDQIKKTQDKSTGKIKADVAKGAVQAVSIEEAVMDTLHKIVAGKSAQSVKFATGETRKVDHFTASALTQVHKALNDENKKKFADMVHKSPAHFSKASDFAFSKAK